MKFPGNISFNIGEASYKFFMIDEEDVTERYVRCLQEQTQYIAQNQQAITLESQKKYIKEINESKTDAIFGLFHDNCLIGTAGAQSITGPLTTIGIFVLDKTDRGKGYGSALVWACTRFLNSFCGCTTFSAGIEKENLPSFGAFRGCGFSIARQTENAYIVSAETQNLSVPKRITKIQLSLKKS